MTTLVAVIAVIAVLWFLPEQARTSARWTPSRPRIPAINRRSFVIGTGTIASAFIMGGVFRALGAQIAKELVGSPNALTAGLALASWPLAGIPASLAANRISTRTASVIGGTAAAVGALLLLPAADLHSLVPERQCAQRLRLRVAVLGRLLAGHHRCALA